MAAALQSRQTAEAQSGGEDEAADGFREDLLAGLSEAQKRIPSKYFYDDVGSQLFERICELPEYYPTRSEIAILTDHADALGALLPDRGVVIEFGCGSERKVRLLLDALRVPAAWVAIDVAETALTHAAAAIARDYPTLDVIPLVADFTAAWVPHDGLPSGPRVGFFPGSTIGNLTPDAAMAFLERARSLLDGGHLVIGVDLKKDTDVLHAAYNDSQGVTAAFNLNVLARANRELGADFRPDAFAHHAFYNAEEGRIEMHLVSGRRQSATIDGHPFMFAEGESIHTENSYKYDVVEFQDMATRAGFEPVQVWCDSDGLFSVHALRAA